MLVPGESGRSLSEETRAGIARVSFLAGLLDRVLPGFLRFRFSCFLIATMRALYHKRTRPELATALYRAFGFTTALRSSRFEGVPLPHLNARLGSRLQVHARRIGSIVRCYLEVSVTRNHRIFNF